MLINLNNALSRGKSHYPIFTTSFPPFTICNEAVLNIGIGSERIRLPVNERFLSAREKIITAV